MNDAPAPNPNDDALNMVDPESGESVVYWAQHLGLSESALRILVAEFGPRILDLKQVILNLADESE